MMKFLEFLKSRGPVMVLLASLVYGILVFAIYFTGYHAMLNNMNRLPITIVNRDTNSNKLSNQLNTTLSKNYDHVKQTRDLSKAKRDLNDRKTYLLVVIPKNFSANVQQNKHAKLDFYVNESNQTSAVSAMKNTANTIGAIVEKQVIVQKSEVALSKDALTKLQQEITTQKAQLQSQTLQMAAVDPQGAQQLAASGQEKLTKAGKDGQAKIMAQAKASYAPIANGISYQIHRTNKVKQGLNYALAPFFTNLALYISTLLGTMLIYGTYAKFAKRWGRWKAFTAMQGTFIILSLVAAVIVKAIVIAMVGTNVDFMTAWGAQALVMLAAYELNSIFVLLLGQMGSAINIFLTMIQVVSCAGMVPLVTMNRFFQLTHYGAPMYYGAQLDFNLFYGGSGNSALFQEIALLVVSLLVINIVIVCFRKKQPIMDFNQLS